jgi:hypothetical protein
MVGRFVALGASREREGWPCRQSPARAEARTLGGRSGVPGLSEQWVASCWLDCFSQEASAVVAGTAGAVASTPPTACTPTTTTYTQSTPLPIPNSQVVTSTIVLAGAGPFLADVDVKTFLKTLSVSQTNVSLTSPAGTVVSLTTRNANRPSTSNRFDGAVWDDDASPGGQVPYGTTQGTRPDYGASSRRIRGVASAKELHRHDADAHQGPAGVDLGGCVDRVDERGAARASGEQAHALQSARPPNRSVCRTTWCTR